jgi:head decoration protein D
MPAFGNIELGTVSVDNLLASQEHIRIVSGITISSGQNLERGCCLGKKTVGGEYYAYNSGATDGTEDLVGILELDTDATSADAGATMYTSGKFNLSDLTYSGASGANVEAGLYAYNQIEIIAEGQ